MVAQYVVEMISSRSAVGELRRRCDAYAEMNEKWKKKTQMLQKMVGDMNIVIKRFINESQSGKNNPAPIKITRSVGLQITTGKVFCYFLKEIFF
jgi:hypothetical protein